MKAVMMMVERILIASLVVIFFKCEGDIQG